MALDDFPSLWIRIRDIKAVDTTGHPHSTRHVQWLPPECPAGFDIVRIRPWQVLTLRSTGNEHSLVPAIQIPGAEMHDLPSHIRVHDTASIFFTSELNSFFEVPYDCTETHVAQRREAVEEDGWGRITFFKHDEAGFPRNPRLWCIGHAQWRKQMDPDVTITHSWNELLLPGSFSNGIQRDGSLPTCELAGKLTLIFGLLAFTIAPDRSYEERIRKSFRYPGTSYYVPTWQTSHSQNQGLISKRGLIVDIAYDQDHCRAKLIEEWEAGVRGPILTSNPSWEQSYVGSVN